MRCWAGIEYDALDGEGVAPAWGYRESGKREDTTPGPDYKSFHEDAVECTVTGRGLAVHLC